MSTSQCTIDPYQHMKIVYNPDDDTLTRLLQFPNTSATSDPNLPISVLSKDLTINQSHNTWLRLFLPRKALDHGSKKNHLPLIVFFHGSGFILASAASTMFHDFCVTMANDIDAIVASVEYRLAPEHRLPAAYDDAVEALHWIKTSDDDWLREYADYGNCYLMGNSAGGTIAYYAGVRVLEEEVEDLEPLKIRGLILRQPAFGGMERSQSELRLKNDSVIPLSVIDMMWEMALPIGEKRDHEYSNPTVGNGVEKMEKIGKMGWRVLMSGNEGDPLVDREKEMVRLMEEKGVTVVTDFDEEGGHGVEFAEPSKASRFTDIVKVFLSSSVVSE